MPGQVVRPATKNDIAWMVAQEQRPDFASLIHRWTPEEHERNLVDGDKLYLIVTDESNQPVGFVILAGLTSTGRSIELVRMAMAQPGTGLGKPVLKTVTLKTGALQFATDQTSMGLASVTSSRLVFTNTL